MRADWVTATGLFKLEAQGPPELTAEVTAVIRRLLLAGGEQDPSDIRFQRGLAVSYGRTQEYGLMAAAIGAALAVDPTDAETQSMAAWAKANIQ